LAVIFWNTAKKNIFSSYYLQRFFYYVQWKFDQRFAKSSEASRWHENPIKSHTVHFPVTVWLLSHNLLKGGFRGENPFYYIVRSSRAKPTTCCYCSLVSLLVGSLVRSHFWFYRLSFDILYQIYLFILHKIKHLIFDILHKGILIWYS